ncbi:MAG: pyruvate kinase [Syntrophaceae bacterium]
MKLPSRKTKIICTIGPSSRSAKVLPDLIRAGMSAARLNFSHDTLEEHGRDIDRIRSAAEALNVSIPILVDLPGPKIRIGNLEVEPLLLRNGENITLTTGEVRGRGAIPVQYELLPEIVSPGSIIYLSDGFIQLKTISVSGKDIICKVIIGGPLLSRQGLNVPGARIFLDSLTERDFQIIDFGLSKGADIFCLSFINRSDDVVRAREHLRRKEQSAYLIAKIERAEAVRNIDEILDVADGIMVARGDLGMDIPIEDVPAVQKLLINKANLKSRPVITATQMLESMISNVRPTRAEVTDVANAILDGTDGIMLSGETAIGKHPVEAVRMMSRIAGAIEGGKGPARHLGEPREDLVRTMDRRQITVGDMISINVIEAAKGLQARLILTPTHTGGTPRRVSRFKPRSWVIAFCRDKRVHDFLNVSYGVCPILVEDPFDQQFLFRYLKDQGLARKGDRVVITEMVAPGQAGGVDFLGITTLT